MGTTIRSTSNISSAFRFSPVERKIILSLVDILIGFLALVIALVVWAGEDSWLNFSILFLKSRPPFWFYLLPFAWSLFLVAFTANTTKNNWQESISSVLFSTAVILLFYFAIYFTTHSPTTLPRLGVIVFVAAAASLSLVWRFFFIRLLSWSPFLKRVVLLGLSADGLQMFNEIYKNVHPAPFICEGIVSLDNSEIPLDMGNIPVIGNTDQLFEIISEKRIDEVILLSTDMSTNFLKFLIKAKGMGIGVEWF